MAVAHVQAEVHGGIGPHADPSRPGGGHHLHARAEARPLEQLDAAAPREPSRLDECHCLDPAQDSTGVPPTERRMAACSRFGVRTPR